MTSHDTLLTVASSQCSMNSARLSMVCVISGMLCWERACFRLDTMSSWCTGRSSIQHDTNAALNNSLGGRDQLVREITFFVHVCAMTKGYLILHSESAVKVVFNCYSYNKFTSSCANNLTLIQSHTFCSSHKG